MALAGMNILKPFKTREEAKISNCDANGDLVNDEGKRKLVFAVPDPVPGIWDLPVLGSYKNLQSDFHLRVDYLMSSFEQEEISGKLADLNGSVKFALKETSMAIAPDPEQSSYELTGLQAESTGQILQGVRGLIPGPSGAKRVYPSDVKNVTFSIHSPNRENEVNPHVMECPLEAAPPSFTGCELIHRDPGARFGKKVEFEPQPEKFYLVMVEGATIKDEGLFTLTETLGFEPEAGSVHIRGKRGQFQIDYSFASSQLQSSKILQYEGFKNGKYQAVGSLTLTSSDRVVLGSIPVSISNPPLGGEGI